MIAPARTAAAAAATIKKHIVIIRIRRGTLLRVR